MYPIFFGWLGTYDDLCMTGFYSYGPTRTVAVAHGKAYIGVIHAPVTARSAIASTITDKRFMLLPGPNGTLSAAHVASIAKIAPKAQLNAGDSMKKALAYVQGLFGDAAFDPDAY